MFGHYEVVTKLGSGSFGDVYEVIDTQDDNRQHYALKNLKNDAPSGGASRFENEVWALEQLDHPSIPKLIAKRLQDPGCYFVMSLAKGTSLRSISKDQCGAMGPCSLRKVLSIIDKLLDILAYMHGRGIIHGDVNDSNILTSESADEVFLLDLGYCKGPERPVQDQSFWLAGASRFSPPDKIHSPSKANPTHDVFAVGVVAYLLLTNTYPWVVDDIFDRSTLEDQMRTVPAIPIDQLNGFVPIGISKSIMRLMTIDDNTRLSAAAARDELRKIKEINPKHSLTHDRAIRLNRVVRDPIHGDIRMTDFEWHLLGTREMQRLRWIKQLGLTNLVYPGAEHSRLSHSIGAMHVADRILCAIQDRSGQRVEPELRLLARTQALVHDVTHIGYGHTIEDELGLFQRHDENVGRSDRLIFNEKSELGRVLSTTAYGRTVKKRFEPPPLLPNKKIPSCIDDLLSGPVGADVLDYVDRDSYFCGLHHRIDDALFRKFNLVPADGQEPDSERFVSRLYGGHGIRLDAEFAIESVLLARFSLFMKVYSHAAKTAAGAMLGKALYYANNGRKPLIPEDKIEWMSDVDILRACQKPNSGAGQEIIKALMMRKLYKIAFRTDVIPSTADLTYKYVDDCRTTLREKGLLAPKTRAALERQIAGMAGVKESEVIVYCSPKAPGFQKVRQHVEKAPRTIHEVAHIDKPYKPIAERHLALWKIYVFGFVSDENTGKLENLGRVAASVLSMPNDIQK